MKKRVPAHLSIALACWGTLAISMVALPVQSQQFTLQDGSSVVFYGDSITAQRIYTKFIEEAVLTRYPALHVRFHNAGVPGDTTYGGYAGAMAGRVQKDVIPFHPAMITVMLGMNDGGYVDPSPKIDSAFQDGYRALIDELHRTSPQAAMTLILPTPYDEITHGTEFPGYSNAIDHIADEAAAIAAGESRLPDEKITVVDAHTPLVKALKQAKASFPQLAPLIIPDRIHPSDTGHWILACAVLSAWHFDPVVSRVTLDAKSGRIAATARTTIAKVEKTGDGLRWTQQDEDLPLPLDLNNAMTAVLLGVSRIAEIDQETLQIENLPDGTYQLLIDGKSIATFSRAELQSGVNLALLKTPMLAQARGLDWYEERRSTLDQARFLLEAEIRKTADTAAAEQKLTSAEEELEALIRTNLVPKPHTFALRRQ
jgi:lysophospholipase L1-like esterase